MKRKINLQLFADGGAGAGASASTGADSTGSEGSGAATGVLGDSPVSQKGEDLSDVVYGVSNNQDVANPTDVKTTKDITPAERQKAFDEMIKKGGEYAEEFNKRTQSIIDKRFKETKGLQEQLASQQSIMETLAAKYGVDASDLQALTKAIDADNSMWEEAAYKEGLSVEAYKQKLALEQENARLKAAQEEAQAQQGANQIYAQWVQESEDLVAKYGLQNFNFQAEMENPEFTQLLGSGISFESAYKTIHFDEMVNGAMAQTAQSVSKAMVNNIQSRASRPAENGTQSASSKVFKTDPNKLTDRDVDEVIKRVARGAEISFG